MTQKYLQFDEEDVNTFLDLMDVEQQGIITLGDIELTCQQLKLSHHYDNIKKLFQHLLHVSKGGLPVEEVKKFLLESDRTEEEQLEDLFDVIDFDNQGQINKNKLKIIINEMTGETISDVEAEEMIRLVRNEDGELDKESFLKLKDMKVETN